MKIKFLGSGSAFVSSDENFHSNILINNDTLFDCGYTISEALKYHKLEEKQIESIIISHMHSDHIGGLPDIGFKNYFLNDKHKVSLISTPTLMKNIANYLDLTMGKLDDGKDAIDGYFEKVNIGDGIVDENGLNILPIKTYHKKQSFSKSKAHTKEESFGVILQEDNTKIFISGDTIFDEKLIPLYRDMDVIFNDVEFNNYPNGVHSQFHELLRLDESIRNKMYLYHYMLNGETYEDLESLVLANGFKGLVKRGDEFNF